MRCHYLSDLHLERQAFPWRLPGGDILIVAGDTCHASCLDPARGDKYAHDQRARVMQVFEAAVASFRHVLVIAGNHEHYDGIFDDTAALLKRHLPGVTVLDDEAVEIDGIAFFGTTLWSDFDNRSEATLDGVRRRMGEFFFVRKRSRDAEGRAHFAKFTPRDALAAHDAAMNALHTHLATRRGKPTVVISHHAPSRQGLDARHAGNGLDGAYASDLDRAIAALEEVPVWVHGHTHVRRSYRIGSTAVHANCRGFDGKDTSARAFRPDASFDL
ncbi:MAG: metallophosphoesterase [Hyphomicrobium sp.]|uniref:metallophosphoesterase n=1 Tax=Hyphomicrobium sp. TaxID=82 RepID=UPI003D148FA5